MKATWMLPLLALLLALLLPSAAIAQKPPGNGVVDEYTEGLPGPEGETPTGGGGSGGEGRGEGGRDDGGTLPPSAAAALEAEGTDGEAVARIVEETAPRLGGGRAGVGAGGGGAAVGGAGAEESADLIDAVGTAVAGEGGGMGAALPLILGVTLLGAVAALLLGRRRGPTE